MSICIIIDHIIMLRKKFHYNAQHIDQVKPKYEGGGLHPPKPPLWIRPCYITWILIWERL